LLGINTTVVACRSDPSEMPSILILLVFFKPAVQQVLEQVPVQFFSSSLISAV
jgi:hypothetical protein